MKKFFRGIVLFLGITYLLCGCGVQHIENSATVETEMLDIVIRPIPATTPSPAPIPSPALTPSPAPTPAALPASPVYLIEYGEMMSSLSVLPSTEGYEKYLAEDLSYHYAYNDSEDGAEYWDFDICLPRFAESMPCYREMNAYFEELYEQLLHEKEHFYDWIEREEE
ncbi:MAG: hypothetical protein K2H12_08740, partial [Acetatifactor sp.]|nr:hypothetical protein [Acetatifactor sp.]